ncbi:MAG TPA: nuclear transport factor 2 family protein [Candidatus Saccharimonadales bacterium]|nr:nuclear transport factor 2 family protein [Candidatus Saccharimonadales bacterium]
MNALDVVNKYLSIILLENNAGEGIMDVVTSDFTFDDPFTKASNAEEFLEKTQLWIKTKKTYTLETEFVKGNHVCKVYTLHVVIPTGETKDFALADIFEIRDGKIAKEKVYFFEPNKFAQAFGIPS